MRAFWVCLCVAFVVACAPRVNQDFAGGIEFVESTETIGFKYDKYSDTYLFQFWSFLGEKGNVLAVYHQSKGSQFNKDNKEYIIVIGRYLPVLTTDGLEVRNEECKRLYVLADNERMELLMEYSVGIEKPFKDNLFARQFAAGLVGGYAFEQVQKHAWATKISDDDLKKLAQATKVEGRVCRLEFSVSPKVQSLLLDYWNYTRHPENIRARED